MIAFKLGAALADAMMIGVIWLVSERFPSMHFATGVVVYCLIGTLMRTNPKPP